MERLSARTTGFVDRALAFSLCTKIKILYTTDRADAIWTPSNGDAQVWLNAHGHQCEMLKAITITHRVAQAYSGDRFTLVTHEWVRNVFPGSYANQSWRNQNQRGVWMKHCKAEQQPVFWVYSIGLPISVFIFAFGFVNCNSLKYLIAKVVALGILKMRGFQQVVANGKPLKLLPIWISSIVWAGHTNLSSNYFNLLEQSTAYYLSILKSYILLVNLKVGWGGLRWLLEQSTFTSHPISMNKYQVALIKRESDPVILSHVWVRWRLEGLKFSFPCKSLFDLSPSPNHTPGPRSYPLTPYLQPGSASLPKPPQLQPLELTALSPSTPNYI